MKASSRFLTFDELFCSILPLFYIVVADEQLKSAIYAKQFKEVARLLFAFH